MVLAVEELKVGYAGEGGAVCVWFGPSAAVVFNVGVVLLRAVVLLPTMGATCSAAVVFNVGVALLLAAVLLPTTGATCLSVFRELI